MSEHTFEELKSMTVAQLRELAAGIEHDAVHGHSTMHKEPLLHAVCTALGLDEHVHHDVVGIDKTEIKRRIHALKAERDDALQAKDKPRFKQILRQIHHAKREIRKATV